jgi:hypothetical protein
MKYLPDTIRFLETLGFEFQLDWDDELEISHPSEIQPEQVSLALRQYADYIVAYLRRRRQKALSHCIGGPFSGRRHGWYYWPSFDGTRYRQFHGLNVSRAKWAVYELMKDGRAYFRGYATSRKKARAGLIASEL